MTKTPFNLDREFIKWFYEEEYPEIGSNRRQVYGTTHGTTNINVIDYWMSEAYKAGAQAMWDDLNYTLGAYAASVEGLDPYLVEPCEIFDRARENLHYYVHKQLELFK